MEINMKSKSSILTEVTKFRRDLHKIPELGFFVYRTGTYIRNVLSEFDCSISTIAKTGIVAVGLERTGSLPLGRIEIGRAHV